MQIETVDSGRVRATHGWSTTERRGEPTHDEGGEGGARVAVDEKTRIEKRR